MPPPPKHLQIRVVGGYVPDFVASGIRMCSEIERVLAIAGKKLTEFSRILDFGCGCGRNTRALKFRCSNAEVFGSDIDPEAIQWLQENGKSVGTFSVNPHSPPTQYPADSFDLVIGISVFTHLPQDMQFQWLAELQRITQPNGYLILTTHGRNHLTNLSQERLAELEHTGFTYQDSFPTDGLPEFYQIAFHRVDYIKTKWSQYFDVIDVIEQGIAPQDAVILRKR